MSFFIVARETDEEKKAKENEERNRHDGLKLDSLAVSVEIHVNLVVVVRQQTKDTPEHFYPGLKSVFFS